MNRLLIILIISFFSLTAAQDKTSEQENEFVKEAAIGSMMEIELGTIASEKASSEKVKEFGQLMIKDHTKASEELKQIASNNNISVPAALDEDHKEKVEELRSIPDESFDKEYMTEMVKDHEKDIENFEDAAENNENEQVKEWAQKTLPTLKEHLKIAQTTLNNLEQITRDVDRDVNE